MAGIYIHVPFCKTRCIYCDFYSNTGNRHSDFLTALHTEMQLRQNYLQQQPIQTIYLGGRHSIATVNQGITTNL